MDQEEILKCIANIKISNKAEKNTLTLEQELRQKGEERITKCLVAKILSSKLINRDTFRQHLPRILQAVKKIDIEVVGENLFILEFTNPVDRRRALRGGPWHFFNNLIIFQELKGTQSPETLDFSTWEVWTQCHNLPVAYMQEEILQRIGNKIGKVIEIDKGDREVILGRFARIKIRLEISQPLQSHIIIHDEEGGEEIYVLLTYEKLPDFCYACGKVGHTWRECGVTDTVGSDMPYGSWLRANPPMGRYKKKPGEESVDKNQSQDWNEAPNTHEDWAVERTGPITKPGNIQEERDREENLQEMSDKLAPVQLEITSTQIEEDAELENMNEN
ncbi:hypothetical protein DH2020_042488 [Rehmannia glutinosa]|uniref:CCHC-type domain-containing protein n=1 Tax=Rehmannia glutinosa TaxID=99300 RepID=A0ABR0UNA8_REHGL